MRKKHKKLTACAVAAMLGLSCMVYPVHAEEAPSGGQTDTGGLLEVDETAVPVEESTEPQATPTLTPEADEPEPVTQEQTENEADKEEPTSQPVETEPEATEQTGGEAEPQEQIQNAAVPYANTGDFVVTGGTYGTDYTYDGNLHILTSTKLTITTNGKATSSMIRGDTWGITYNIVFRDLYLNGKQNDNHVNFPGHTNLTIFGTNKLDVYGVGLTSGSLTITADSTGSLSLNAGGDVDIWLDGAGSSNANLEVNGGSLTYGDADIAGSINTSGTGTINGKPEKSPVPTVTIAGTTASSITVTELENKDTYGGAEYSLDGHNWQTSNVLTDLHSNTAYTVYARYKGNNDGYAQSDAGKIENISTKPANYTITIPAEPVEAGNSESKAELKPSNDFDLGYNGTAMVKVKKDSGVDKDGKLTLTRQNDTENHTIASALLVNNNALGDINKSVATFTMDNKTPVSVSFAKPTETDIPAGTYNGTITFEVSYSEPTA